MIGPGERSWLHESIGEAPIKTEMKMNSINRPRFVRFLGSCLLVCAVAIGAAAQTGHSPLGPPTGYVNDYANVIDAATKQRLETILTNLKQRADIEIAVVTVPTTGDQDIFDYSLAVARGWGIGAKGGDKAGLLLLVAINDRKYFTQVSDHLEGDLPDGLVGQIQRERLVPQFRKQNYSQGINDTIQAYIATLADKRNFSIEGIDRSASYRDSDNRSRSRPDRRGNASIGSCCLFIFLLFMIVSVLSSLKRGGSGSGCLNALLLGSLVSNVSRRGSSGWMGGGFGGGGGGFGGGGFGGFGGGGSFGGGGAGGSW